MASRPKRSPPDVSSNTNEDRRAKIYESIMPVTKKVADSVLQNIHYVETEPPLSQVREQLEHDLAKHKYPPFEKIFPYDPKTFFYDAKDGAALKKLSSLDMEMEIDARAERMKDIRELWDDLRPKDESSELEEDEESEDESLRKKPKKLAQPAKGKAAKDKGKQKKKSKRKFDSESDESEEEMEPTSDEYGSASPIESDESDEDEKPQTIKAKPARRTPSNAGHVNLEDILRAQVTFDELLKFYLRKNFAQLRAIVKLRNGGVAEITSIEECGDYQIKNLSYSVSLEIKSLNDDSTHVIRLDGVSNDKITEADFEQLTNGDFLPRSDLRRFEDSLDEMRKPEQNKEIWERHYKMVQMGRKAPNFLSEVLQEQKSQLQLVNEEFRNIINDQNDRDSEALEQELGVTREVLEARIAEIEGYLREKTQGQLGTRPKSIAVNNKSLFDRAVEATMKQTMQKKVEKEVEKDEKQETVATESDLQQLLSKALNEAGLEKQDGDDDEDSDDDIFLSGGKK